MNSRLNAIPFNILILLFSIIYFIARSTYNLEGMFICGFIILCITIGKYFLSFDENVAFILFLFSCFLFMQGLYLVNILINGQMNTGFSYEISQHINDCILISILCLNVGYYLGSKFKFVAGKKKNNKYNTICMENIQKCSLFLFLLAVLVNALVIVDVIIFVKNYSYLEYYLTYSTHLPRILQIFGNMYLVFFVIYLATCPTKKSCKWPTRLFLLMTLLILISGDRGGVIQNLGLWIVYALWRQKKDGEVWIKKRYIVIGFILLPFLLSFLSFFVSIREGIDVGEVTILSQIKRFVSITGRSAGVIGYGKKYEGLFPQNWYTIGGIIDYIKYNPITCALFGYSKPIPQTRDYAYTMHAFDSILSYFVYPESYVRGHGVGSSYVAEAYHDFGYLGVGIINVLYGIIFKKLNKFNSLNPYKFAIILLIIRSLFYAPRGPAAYFITCLLNITTITAFIIVDLATKRKIQIH